MILVSASAETSDVLVDSSKVCAKAGQLGVPSVHRLVNVCVRLEHTPKGEVPSVHNILCQLEIGQVSGVCRDLNVDIIPLSELLAKLLADSSDRIGKGLGKGLGEVVHGKGRSLSTPRGEPYILRVYYGFGRSGPRAGLVEIDPHCLELALGGEVLQVCLLLVLEHLVSLHL